MLSAGRRLVLANTSSCAIRGAARAGLSTYKTSTGLVGLSVDVDARETLIKVSADVLASVKKIPAESMYRVNVEKWYNFFTKVAMEKKDIKSIEEEIGLGQIEEVIEIAKDELELVSYYYENKGWELVANEQARAATLVKEQEDSIYFTQPMPTPPPPPTPK